MSMKKPKLSCSPSAATKLVVARLNDATSIAYA
ncbi:hypothetical protein PVAP13_6NG283801 [Panicum virgatum]|uniref:Uncharacterized protein n=1 Tax=Panicum virgatum TaxID=38727 RepID=A0A8T0R4D1_PANVG|nr:hypothetical protein PVAP13_6NG283801 [Panicum virgatum]